MAFIHSKDAVFQLRNAGNTAWITLSDSMRSGSFSRGADTPETTVLSDDSKSFIAGLLDGSASFSGPVDATGYADLRALLNKTTQFKAYPAGNSAGKPVETVDVIMKSCEVSAGAGDALEVSIELQFTGDVTSGTV